jgi:putative inorganic carbon (hco3(-)) transporter
VSSPASLTISERPLALPLGVAALLLAGFVAGVRGEFLFLLLVFGAGAVAAAFLARVVDPAWTFSLGLLLSPFAGHWGKMGLPSLVSPDRLLFLVGFVVIFTRYRSLLRWRPVYWLMAMTIAFALGSAAWAGTLGDKASFAVLIERLGIVPFLVFAAAPAAFGTERQRRVLLVSLIGLGAYLGITALAETLSLHALVFPGYIADPNYGIHPDRARGPFLEPATFGVALFTCFGACCIGLQTFRRTSMRLVIGGIAALCAAGLLFTLTRQVWLATVVAGLLVFLITPRLRVLLAPAAVAMVLMVAGLLAVVPAIADRVQERRAQSDTVFDRYNLNNAALNAVTDRPLVGVGWENWTASNADYFELNENYPLTRVKNVNIHNLFLAYAAQIGLIGFSLWLVTFAVGVGGSFARRGPPEVTSWRVLAAAVTTFFLVIATFEFPQVFSNLIVWVLAGVVAAPYMRQRAAEELEVRRASGFQS